MRISVISFNGAPLPGPLGFDFDSRGGAIGREEGNELMLPDPERHISRVQARIEFDGVNFVIVDMGGYVLEAEFHHAALVFSNPTQVASGGADPLGLSGGASAGSPLFADPLQASPAAPAVSSLPTTCSTNTSKPGWTAPSRSATPAMPWASSPARSLPLAWPGS